MFIPCQVPETILKLIKALLLVVVVTGLVGCAQPLKKQAFNSAAAAHIVTLVVTQKPNQDQYDAAVLAHPGVSFGLIGGLIAAADMQNKSNQLTASIDPKETRLQERLGFILQNRLTQSGYQVKTVTLKKDTKDEEILGQVRALGETSDAVLSVDLTGAYWAAGPGSDYFPRLVARVKKIDGKDGKTLYEDLLTYGYNSPQLQSVHLISAEQFRFATIGALTADAAKTRKGLLDGLDAIADQIVIDLKKP